MLENQKTHCEHVLLFRLLPAAASRSSAFFIWILTIDLHLHIRLRKHGGDFHGPFRTIQTNKQTKEQKVSIRVSRTLVGAVAFDSALFCFPWQTVFLANQLVHLSTEHAYYILRLAAFGIYTQTSRRTQCANKRNLKTNNTIKPNCPNTTLAN